MDSIALIVAFCLAFFLGLLAVVGFCGLVVLVLVLVKKNKKSPDRQSVKRGTEDD